CAFIAGALYGRLNVQVARQALSLKHNSEPTIPSPPRFFRRSIPWMTRSGSLPIFAEPASLWTIIQWRVIVRTSTETVFHRHRVSLLSAMAQLFAWLEPCSFVSALDR